GVSFVFFTVLERFNKVLLILFSVFGILFMDRLIVPSWPDPILTIVEDSLIVSFFLIPVIILNEFCRYVVCQFPSVFSWVVCPLNEIFSSLSLFVVSIFDDSFEIEFCRFCFF